MRPTTTLRRLACGAVLAVTACSTPLLAGAASAVPAFGSCAATVDPVGRLITLTDDCSTSSTLTVPDGYTLDGAGHTITAVQDAGQPAFSGAVVSSATGDSTAAASMDLTDLHITTSGFDQVAPADTLYGIAMVRAGGSLHDVSVDRIVQGSGDQVSGGTARAIYVDNEDNGSRDVPRATLVLDGVTVTHYQKSGIYLRGNLAYTAQHLIVGQAGTPDGSPNTLLAANGVSLVDGVAGSLTDSRLAENRYSTDDDGTSGNPAEATSILLYDAGPTTLTRNVITGTDGDVGVDVYNDSNTITTDVSVTCSSLLRTDGGHADPTLGYAISNDGNPADSVHLSVGSNNYSGWVTDVLGAHTTVTDPACVSSSTLSASPTTLTYGSNTRLSGRVTNADGSAAVGQVDLQARPNGSSTWTVVDSAQVNTNGAYAFTDVPTRRTSYRVHFTGPTEVGSYARAVVVAVAPRVGIRVSPSPVKRSGTVTFSGGVTPRLRGNTVLLQEQRGLRWVTVRQGVLSSAGSYSLTWKAPSTAGRHTFRVQVSASSDYLAGTSITKTVAVR